MKNIKQWLVVVSLTGMGFIFLSCSKSGKDGDGDQNTPRTNVPAAFVGTFYYGDVSNTNYYNPNNGSWNSVVGSNQAYTFFADGTFEFGFRASVMIGNCSNVGMVYRRGTVAVNGNQLTLYDNYAKVMEQHSCNPSTNYDKHTSKKTEVLIAEPAVDAWGNPGLNLRSPTSTANFFIKKS